MNRQFRSMAGYLLLICIAVLLVTSFTGQFMGQNEYSYTQFTQAVEDGKVSSAVIAQNTVDSTSGTVHIIMTDGTEREVVVPDTVEAKDLLVEKEIPVTFTRVRDNSWLTSLGVPLLVAVVVVFLMVTIMNQQAAGGSSNGMRNFGKSRARMTTQDQIKVSFKSVAGLQEEKEDLKEIVDFLKFPQRYVQLGARIPKGVILVGPPGTGKTLLAKAVAGEAGVPFFSISGSDFVEMFVGVGASRVRDLFEDAKQNAPCIVFIDEIDAVARRRGTGMGGGHDEREQTLNQLLVEMDGFGVNEGIIVIAATNRVDILDPAILRPGRFDRKVVVGRPDIRGREEILHVHAKGKPLGEDVDLKQIAQTTAGMTGADLENLLKIGRAHV